MNPEILVDTVLRGVLGGRRKRSAGALRYLTGKGGGSLLNPSTLLGAAGVAWGICETLQREAGGAAPVAAAPVTGPLPLAASPAASPATRQDEALRFVRLVISAANADGAMTEQERAAVRAQAEKAHVVDLLGLAPAAVQALEQKAQARIDAGA